MDSDRKQILVLYPHGDALDQSGSGGQNRLFHLIMQATQFHDVTVVSPYNSVYTGDEVEMKTYQRRTPGFVSDLDFSLARRLYEIIREESPDIIHVPYPSGIVLSRFLTILSATNTKILLDAHDVMSERAREFENDNLSFTSAQFRRIYIPFLERLATAAADHVITVSEKDARLMENLNKVPSEKISVIPNGAELIAHDDLKPRSTVRNRLDIPPDTTALVFHGNCETGTHNKEAATMIIEEIAPQFQDHDVHFFVVGKGVPEPQTNNVTSLGFVEDLYSTLNAMDIAVVPLTSGTATKLKMFDYMSVGLPIISTPKGTEGIDVENKQDVLITELESGSFSESIQQVLDDPSLQAKLSENGRRLIQERYNWNTIGLEFNSVIRSL